MALAEDEAADEVPGAVALAGVAHDLEGLLGVVALRAEVAERQLARGDVPGARISLEVVRRAVEETRRLTGDMRAGALRTPPPCRSVDLCRLLEQLSPSSTPWPVRLSWSSGASGPSPR